MSKFWAWAQAVTGEPELIIEGVITSEAWYDDDITPKMFRDELSAKGKGGDIILRINSPGGDPFAASDIYTSIMEYPGKVRGKITGLAASAAAFLAMACDELHMSDVAEMMVHKASSGAYGNEDRLKNIVTMLQAVDTSMVTAFARKTGKTEEEIRGYLAQGDYWMTAQQAVDLGFADGLLDYHTEYKAAAKYAACATAKALIERAENGDATESEQSERQAILQENKKLMEE